MRFVKSRCLPTNAQRQSDPRLNRRSAWFQRSAIVWRVGANFIEGLGVGAATESVYRMLHKPECRGAGTAADLGCPPDSKGGSIQTPPISRAIIL